MLRPPLEVGVSTLGQQTTALDLRTKQCGALLEPSTSELPSLGGTPYYGCGMKPTFLSCGSWAVTNILYPLSLSMQMETVLHQVVVTTLEDHKPSVLGTAFSVDNRTLFSKSYDDIVRRWDFDPIRPEVAPSSTIKKLPCAGSASLH